MMTWGQGLDAAVVSTIGWTLIHFLWQGALLAVVMGIVQRWVAAADNRYRLALATLVAMGLAPLLTFAYLRSSQDAPGLSPGAPAAGLFAGVGSSPNFWKAGTLAQHPAWNSTEIVAGLWLMGVFLFSLRAAGGWWMLRRLRQRCRELAPEPILSMCLELRQRMGIRRVVRFCASTAVEAPAVLGWFRPIVLLPLASMSGLSLEQLEAVIAHELAHIQRLDAFVNLLQVAIETLLFYHPAVWWVSRVVRTEREHCCDDVAVAVRGDALDYARALALMEEKRLLPQFALAVNSRPLRDRVARLLGAERPVRPVPAAVVLALCLVTGGAALLAARPALSETLTIIEERFYTGQSGAQAQASASAQAAASSRSSEQAGQTEAIGEVQSLRAARAFRAVTRLVASTETAESIGVESAAEQEAGQHEAAQHETAQPEAAQQDSKPGHTSYIDEMAAAGYRDLTVDQLIEMKTQGVTGGYVRELAEAGLHPDLNHLIELRIQGVTGQYVRDIRAAGLDPDVHLLIEMKVQGVNADYVRRINAAGLHPDLHHLIEMKIQGVSPEYMQELKAAGIDADLDHLIEMKIQGVTPEYLREIRAAGWNPSVDQLVAMKIQGVGPGSAAEFKKIGFTDLTIDRLIGAKIQGVTPAYVAAMRAAGLQDQSIDHYIEAKIQGVTPEFVEKARQHGFKDLTLEKLIRLRMADVL
jgi:beta-lactamase regulating signal transducer with metallopeptidase domain